MKRMFIILGIVLCLFTACSAAKEPTTEVLQATFSDGRGGTLDYYTVKTTYHSTVPESAAGLHTDAFRAVFDLDNTVLLKEFDVGGHAAAIYQGKSRNYICCTSSPTASVVMAYDPNAVTEEDMIRTIQSIYPNPV